MACFANNPRRVEHGYKVGVYRTYNYTDAYQMQRELAAARIQSDARDEGKYERDYVVYVKARNNKVDEIVRAHKPTHEIGQRNPRFLPKSLFDSYIVRTTGGEVTVDKIQTLGGAERKAKELQKKYPCAGIEIVSEKHGSVIKAFEPTVTGKGKVKTDNTRSYLKDQKKEAAAEVKYALYIDGEEYATFDTEAEAKATGKEEGKGKHVRIKPVAGNPFGDFAHKLMKHFATLDHAPKGLDFDQLRDYLVYHSERMTRGEANEIVEQWERSRKQRRNPRDMMSANPAGAYYVVYWKSASTGRSGWERVPASSPREAKASIGWYAPVRDAVAVDVERSPFKGRASNEYNKNPGAGFASTLNDRQDKIGDDIRKAEREVSDWLDEVEVYAKKITSEATQRTYGAQYAAAKRKWEAAKRKLSALWKKSNANLKQIQKAGDGRALVGRRNPESPSSADAAALYREFHGVDSDGEFDIVDRLEVDDTFAGLGQLVEMWILPVHSRGNKSVKILAPDPDKNDLHKVVTLASNPEGNQLYFVGGDQSLDVKALGFSRDEEKPHMVIGILTEITYLTQKKFHKLVPTQYFHKLGEETGVEPLLVYDPINCQMSVVGGAYKVKDVGIVN